MKRAPSSAYRRVLVLIDFSPSWEKALHAALAVAPNAAIYVLHAFEVPFESRLRMAGATEADLTQYSDRERAVALQQLNVLLSRVPSDRPRIFPIIERGDIRSLAEQVMESMDPDLVAVGKHGRSFLQDLFLDSVTRRILAEASCDVLVIPQQPA